MLKILGSVLVVLAFGLAGMSIGNGFLRRPSLLRHLQAALQMLETEIIYGAAQLDDAMERVAERANSAVQILFKSAAQRLRENSGITAAEAWRSAVEVFYKKSVLHQGDAAILQDFGSTLGLSDKEDQKKHFRLVAQQLQQNIVTAAEEAQRNTKLWNYLGFITGLVVVLVLY